MVSIQDILGAPNLCGLITTVKGGVPNPWGPEWERVDKTVDGDTGSYKQVKGTRQLARLAAYGSASRTRQLKGISEKAVKLLHTNENIMLPMAAYMNLLNYEDLSKQRLGEQEVARQIQEFKRLFTNLRVSAMTMMMFTGHIYSDGEGNILPDSTGANSDIDYGIPATHINQIDGLISAKWDVAATNIAQQIQTIRQRSLEETGYELTRCYYGAKVSSLLAANTTLQNFFWRNDEANPAYLASGEIPGKLLGLTWKPAYQAFYANAADVIVKPVGDFDILLTPEPEADWIGWLEGTYPVPRSIDIDPSEAGATGQVDVVAGQYAYSQLLTDPVTAKIIAGDTFLPVLKNPLAVYRGTVVW
jgi:hypothetical protein